MVKKLFVIVFLLILGINGYATIRYFSTTGNDVSGNGTLSLPYASLGKAASVAVAGDVIHGVAGIYTQTTQVILAPLVNIEGEGVATQVKLRYNLPGGNSGIYDQAALQLNSTTQGTNGNQTISDIWFDGDNFFCLMGVLVRRRSNVIFQRCRFTNFGVCAINFYGKSGEAGGIPPTTFSSGNQVLNCTILNSGDRQTQSANNVSCGSITWSGQRNILFQYDTLRNISKPQGHNGNLFASIRGNNIGTKWLNCIFEKPADEANQFNFGIENWYDQGGTIYAYNTYTGGGNAIDIGYGSANKGDSSYSWWIHHNIFTNPSFLVGQPGFQPVLSIAIQFESSTRVATLPGVPQNLYDGDAIIEYNYCSNFGSLVQIGLANYSLDKINHININHNECHYTGYANSTYSAIFSFSISNGVKIDSIFIDNNTLVSTTGVGANKGIIIMQCDMGVISNIYFRNNIAMNSNGYGYMVFRGSFPCNNIFTKNNITFNNSFTNNPFVFTSPIAPPPSNLTNTGNLKVDPQFVSLSDFHLKSTSPGVNGGLSPPGYTSTGYYIGAFPPGNITPTITWNNPSPITYGTPLSGTQLNATSGGVPGTFAYTPAAGTILNAGTQTLNVIFTPTDQVTYSVVSKSVTIVVNKAAATLTYSNLTQTYTGAPLQPTVTTNPAGLTVLSTTFNGVGTIPTNAGTYTVITGLTNPNYSAPTITGTFTITKAAATINISNLAQVYNGSQRPIIATTSPVGLTVLTTTYNGSSTPPTNAGSYSIIVSLNNPNYTATNATGTLVVAKATPTVSWSNPSAITYPTALSGTQLNATASVAGAFTYTPASGAILNAGSQTLRVDFAPTDNTNYNSVLNTTVTLIVNKGTATISLSNLAQVYDGTGKNAIATTSPAGLTVVQITYDGSLTLPINAGTYAVVASLFNSNYDATPATGNLVISKATATLSLSNTIYTYDGTQKAVTVTTAPVGLTTVSVLYNGSGTPPTNAGSYPVVATLTNANYQGSINGTLTINKATPVISWPTPAAITYGTALSSTQLNATSGGVAGTFVYTPASGSVLNAGTYTLIADFTPTDGTNYNSVNGTSVSLTVNKATATINLSNLAQDFDGSPKPVTVSTTPLGLGVLAVTYNGSATVPSAVGSYSVNVTLTNTNYTATPATGTLVISASSAAIFITDNNQTYTGSPLNVTVTTNPGGLSHTLTYNGSATAPTAAGSYTTIATINDGVHTGADTAIFVIAKANPVITWGNPAPITYGTALSGSQLNASASVAGSFVYTPTSGAVLNVGVQTLSAQFTPTDAANYNSIPVTTVSLIVNKATATITISNTTQAFDGTPKPVTVSTSPAGLAILTTTYNGSTTAPTAVGTYQVISNLSNPNYDAVADTATLTISTTSAGISISNLSQTYTGSALPVTVTTNPTGISNTVTYNGSGTAPTNVGSYTVIATLNDGIHTGADTQTLVISKATPAVVWGNPNDIIYGTALSSTQLNATTGVAGSFVYAPTTGTVLNVGTAQSLSVVFTPTDGSNYNSVTKIVSINVLAAEATLSLSGLSQTYNGTPRPVTVTTSPTGLSGVTILYNGSSTAPTNAGPYAVQVSLVNSNYTATPVTGILQIGKVQPILSWVVPAQITYPTPLSNLQLNATANVAGTFTYTPVTGTILNPGTTSLLATFHPSDLVNYTNNRTITVPLSVSGGPFLLWYLTHGGTIYQDQPNQ